MKFMILAITASLFLLATSTGTAKENPIVKLDAKQNIYELVAEAPGVVLVDFYADWCGPCREQSRILEQSKQTACRNQASIIKVNVDKHRELAKRYKVSSLPTLLVVKDGKIVERKTGIADHRKVAALLAR